MYYSPEWKFPFRSSSDLGHYVRDWEVGDHLLLAIQQTVTLHRTGAGPGDVVLGEQGALGVAGGARGVADDGWLVDGLLLQSDLQLLLSQAGPQLEELWPVDDAVLVTLLLPVHHNAPQVGQLGPHL